MILSWVHTAFKKYETNQNSQFVITKLVFIYYSI